MKRSLHNVTLKNKTSLGLVALFCGMGLVACGEDDKKGSSDDSSSDASSGSSDSSGTGSAIGSSSSGAGTGATGSNTTASSTGGTGATGDSTGTGAGDSSGTSDSLASGTDTASSGPTCTLPSLQVFTRSDTADVWDDNDFSDVMTEGTCPLSLNVTWPHEAGWEDADPSEANQEQVHFTLDSYYSTDLTGKQINLTIELLEDVRSPEATTGGYEVGIVSVSSYQFETLQPVDTGSVSTTSGDAGVVGADASVDAGVLEGDAEAGAVPMMTVVQTGYSEAESPAEDRVKLKFVGDRATVRFALPNVAELGSYDPASVIKINVRVYNMFDAPEPEPQDSGDAGIALDAGDAETSSEDALSSSSGASSASSASSSTASSSAASSAASSGGASSTSSSSASSSADSLESSTSSESTSGATGPKPKSYGYLTSKFAITDFAVIDAQ